MRFNGICIISADVRRLAEFYIQVLGVEGTVNSTFVGLATKGAALSIFPEEGMESMASGSMRGAGRGGYTIEFEVDVDRQYQRLQAMQVPIVKPPTTQPGGRRSVWFRDPDGNIVNFCADLAPQGEAGLALSFSLQSVDKGIVHSADDAPEIVGSPPHLEGHHLVDEEAFVRPLRAAGYPPGPGSPSQSSSGCPSGSFSWLFG